MITAEDKLEAQSLLRQAFDTFKEEIIIFKRPTSVVNSSNDSFNFAFGSSQPDFDFSYNPSSGVFSATVFYIDLETAQRNDYPIDYAKIKNARSIVKIKVTGDAKEFMDECEKVVIDGHGYELVSQPIRRGIFSRPYFDYFLSKIDSDNG